jgi:hypothetical protein
VPRQQLSASASGSSSVASSSVLPPSEGGPPHGQSISIPRPPNTSVKISATLLKLF